MSQSVSGVQRHARELVLAISKESKKANNYFDITTHVPSNAAVSDLLSSATEVKKSYFLSGHLWEQFYLPNVCNGALINLCNTYPILKKKQILVIHDASVYAVPQGYTKTFVVFYRFLYWFLRFKTSVRILTDSEFSRQEIAHYIGIDKSRITVAYCGADHWDRIIPDSTMADRLGLAGKRYLLAVGSSNPNKNLDRLVAAYALLNRPDIPLVLVGGSNKRVFAQEEKSDFRGIVRAGYVSDSELAGLYASAAGFVFPSLYEGFGLPPLEAMFFGCPVISSREASLLEVCGDAALYCDARDPANIADAMSRILDDEDFRRTLIASGSKQVQKFKWQNTAKAVIDLALKIA